MKNKLDNYGSLKEKINDLENEINKNVNKHCLPRNNKTKCNNPSKA